MLFIFRYHAISIVYHATIVYKGTEHIKCGYLRRGREGDIFICPNLFFVAKSFASICFVAHLFFLLRTSAKAWNCMNFFGALYKRSLP